MRFLYKNESDATINHPEAGPFTPGQSKTLRYCLRNLKGLTLITYDYVSPLPLIVNDTLGDVEAIGGLGIYRKFLIYNKSEDAPLLVTFNGDDDNTLEVAALSQITIENDQDIESMSFSGTDTSAYIKVWGVVRKDG